MRTRRLLDPRLVVMLVVVALASSGCLGAWQTLRAGLAYEAAPFPDGRVLFDVPYRSDPQADPEKHRLDLFLPSASEPGWPTLVFVHGGGWTAGDRATGLFGIEPYRNIGRFYAARGYGVVVPSYRLQPDVTWREQIEDVAAAVAFAREEIAKRGGDPDAIHLAGHSAGAWLAAWIGLDDGALADRGLDRSFVCGLVLVSGAGYDPEDAETYALGASPRYFAQRFATGSASWARTASIRRHLDRPSPPALILNAGGEAVTFRRQADLLYSALSPVAPASRRLEVPGLDHQRIVVAMSAADNPVSDATLGFLGERRCGAGAARAPAAGLTPPRG